MTKSFVAQYRPVLVLVVVAAFAEAAYAAINMLALQVFVHEVLNLTAYLGVILGSFLLVEALMKTVMGALADRHGRWKFLGVAPVVSGCTALLIAALGTAVHRALSPGDGAPAVYDSWLTILLVLTPLMIIRAVDGVAAAAFWPTMFATMADTAPEHRRTSAMSTLTVAYMAGVALGPWLAGWANDRSPLARQGTPTVTQVQVQLAPEEPPVGHFYVTGRVQRVDPKSRTLVVDNRSMWINQRAKILLGDDQGAFEDLEPGQWVAVQAGNKAAAFFMVSILFFATAVLALLLVPRRAPVRAEGSGEHDKLSLHDLTIALRLAPSLVVTALVVFVAVGSLAGIAAIYAQEIFHLSDLEYGRLFIPPAIVIGCLTLPIGLLSDHWGRAHSVHVGIGTAFTALALMAAVAILEPLATLRTEPVLAILATVLGLGFVMGLPAWLATVADVAGEERRAQMIGAVATAEGLGAFLGMLVGPILFDQRKHAPFMIHAPLLMAVVFLGIGFAISLFTIRPHSRAGLAARPEPGPPPAPAPAPQPEHLNR
jgi:MFS family permease